MQKNVKTLPSRKIFPRTDLDNTGHWGIIRYTNKLYQQLVGFEVKRGTEYLTLNNKEVQFSRTGT